MVSGLERDNKSRLTRKSEGKNIIAGNLAATLFGYYQVLPTSTDSWE
jgi:hypothetical protein